MTISRLSFCLPASPIASWLIPSIRQPSPAMTQVWWSTILRPKRAAQALLGDRHADGVGEALAERAGRGLDPRGVAVLGVARGLRAELAEVLDLVDRHVRVAGQVQQPVEQHRAVAGREHEAVAVGPGGRGGVELQVLLEQDRRHVRHAHRHARMAGIRLLDRVHRQHPQRGRLHPVVGVALAELGDVHRGGLSCMRAPPGGQPGLGTDNSPTPGVKAVREAYRSRVSPALAPHPGRPPGMRGTDCNVAGALPRNGGARRDFESAEMSQITQLEAQLAEALDRLRSALAAREAAAAPQPDERALLERIAALESEKAELADELERLRVKRDKDVAALDDLIAQLKPLIEEV